MLLAFAFVFSTAGLSSKVMATEPITGEVIIEEDTPITEVEPVFPTDPVEEPTDPVEEPTDDDTTGGDDTTVEDDKTPTDEEKPADDKAGTDDKTPADDKTSTDDKKSDDDEIEDLSNDPVYQAHHADQKGDITKEASGSDSPKTGDMGVIAYLALAVSGIATLAASKKRK